jgi:hypothetical protein
MKMANGQSLGKRWENYRPSKAVWFWSGMGCAVATIVIGFAWGGWVTGGTATRMASEAATGARAQLAAADCISRFQSDPNAPAQLALLKKTETYERSDLMDKGGWTTMPGSKDPVAGAGDICADQLMTTTATAAKQ